LSQAENGFSFTIRYYFLDKNNVSLHILFIMEQKTLSRPPLRINRDCVEMLLAAHRITRTRIARQAGVHLVTVSRVLRNRRCVSPEKQMAVLRAIATLTGRDPDALVLGRLAA